MTKKKQQRRPHAFTIDRLHQIADKHREITLEQLQVEFDWLTRRDITQRLNQMRRSGALDYQKGYKNITMIAPRSAKAEITLPDDELGRLQTYFLVSDVYELTQLIEGNGLKDREKLKACEQRTKIMLNLTNKTAIEFAKAFEERLGIRLAWQTEKGETTHE